LQHLYSPLLSGSSNMNIPVSVRASFMVTPTCRRLSPPPHQLLVAGPTVIITACRSEVWAANERGEITVVVPQNVLSPACCRHFAIRWLPSFSLLHIGIVSPPHRHCARFSPPIIFVCGCQ
jgi:hypothetical protein